MPFTDQMNFTRRNYIVDMSADDAKPVIKDTVEAFFEELADYVEANEITTPQTTVYSPTRVSRQDSENIVTQPSKLIETHKPLRSSFFTETAEWLVESGNGFGFPPALDPDQTEPIKQIYRDRLFEFAQLVLDYTGGFEFSDEAFDATYTDFIRPRYQSAHTHEVIIPLQKFGLIDREHPREAELLLDPLITTDELRSLHGEMVSDIEISRLSDWELSGFQSYGLPFMSTDIGDLKRDIRWSNKIRLEIEIKHRATAHDDERPGIARSWTTDLAKQMGVRIAVQVMTALRLFKPRSYVGIGPVYLVDRSWRAYRDFCMDVEAYFDSAHSSSSPVIRMVSYQLEKDEYEDFRQFWTSYGDVCDPELDSYLSSPVRRFNQMFRSKSPEDRVVDGYLGFETTMAYEGVTKFHFLARAIFLFQDRNLYLSNPKEMKLRFIHDFVKRLQNERNRIVHDDAKLEMGAYDPNVDLPDDPTVDDLSSREFVWETRYFLSQAIQEYSELISKYGLSIQEINQKKIDPKIIDAVCN